MKYRKFILTILLFVLSISINAQNRINGIVVDDKTNERLAFVNIVINDDGTLGTTSDIDGKFSITTKKEINNLTFSFVGYEKKTIDIEVGQDNISVSLEPSNIQLSEIVIDGSNNPANRIIDSVLKYRDSNNPKNLDSYYYKIYDNMVFTIDTTGLQPNDVMYNEFQDKDLMAMETVSEQLFKKPNKSQKNIIANKVSGIDSPMFVYIIENIQSIGFQEDLITINEKQYINPISNGSKKKYIFVLESTLKTDSNDSIFVISFKPYRNTNFNALSGTMTINSDKWAIQNIKAEPSKQDAMFNIAIQQLYEKVNGYWFPKQLNTNISFNMLDVYTMMGIGKSYITEIEINKDLDRSNFSNADYVISDKAGDSDDVIKAYRYEELSGERLDATYKFVDSIFAAENINMDKIAGIMTNLMYDEIPIKSINLTVGDIMDYNIGNGYMLGLGFRTNERLSKIFSVGAFGNYWFKAKEFNYGGNLDFNLLTSKDMKLKFHAAHEFERLGNYGFNEENNNILNQSNYKHFYIKATSLNNIVSAEYSTYFNKHLKGFVRFEVADKEVFDNSQILSFSDSQFYRLSTLDLGLRIAFGEKFIKTSQGLSVEGNANPVIWLSYQKNLKGVFGSPYNFDKIEFQFQGKKEFKYLGETSVTAQAGYIHGVAPITELFNIEGSGTDRFDIYSPESFNTMRPDEFFCDRFAALYFSHNFKNLLFDFKKFHPEITVVTNIAWGDLEMQRLNNAVTQRLGNLETWGLSDLKKGYYESGLIVDNIIRILYMKLGFGTFYRYGPYSYDDTWDNFVFKINMTFGL
ncbi:MAG: carboxypeptidase-like regulatory domain-containing protein [Lentimicrobiaceae bacterium]|nr:carboxypeptidase-like regulatory domain-containing protein [Lentimicrobiaceae bacterium]